MQNMQNILYILFIMLDINGLDIVNFRKKFNLTQTEFSELIGSSLRTVQNYEKGTVIPASKHEIIRNVFNKYENESKNNEIQTTQNVLISNDTEIDILQNKNGNTYYMYEDGSVEIEVLNLPFPAYASYIQSYFDETQMMEELTTVRFAVDKVGKGNYMSFDIKGDSMNGGMLDDTPDGAKVLARELGKHLWQSFRPEKYGYILMTKDNIYHKDIVDYNPDNGKLTLHSRNPKCEDFTINLNDVYRIFYIIKRTF